MAINFPATGGQPTDGSFTYTVAGITYSWNGESWTAAGAGASATDRTLFSVTTASPGSTALTYDQNTGVFEYTPPNLSGYLTSEQDTLQLVLSRGNLTGPGNNIDMSDLARLNLGTDADAYLRSDNTDIDFTVDLVGAKLKITNTQNDTLIQKNNTDPLAVFKPTGGVDLYWQGASNAGKKFETTASGATISGQLTAGGLTYPNTNGNPNEILTSDGAGNVTWGVPAGLQVRQSVSVSGTITGGAFSNSSVNMGKTVALLSIQSNSPAWVVLYADTASRTADANRSRNTSPAPGSGVIAEVIFTASGTQLLTPGVFGFSPSGGTTYYTKITNDGSTGNVSVDFTYVQLEA